MDEKPRKTKYIISSDSSKFKQRIKFNQLLASLTKRNSNVSKTIISYSNTTDIEKLEYLISINCHKPTNSLTSRAKPRIKDNSLTNSKSFINSQKNKSKSEITSPATKILSIDRNPKRKRKKQEMKLSLISLSSKRFPKNFDQRKNYSFKLENDIYLKGENSKKKKTEKKAFSEDISKNIKDLKDFKPSIASFNTSRFATLPHLSISMDRKYLNEEEIIQKLYPKSNFRNDSKKKSIKLKKNLSNLSYISSFQTKNINTFKINLSPPEKK